MIIGKLIEDPSEYTMAFLIYLIRKNLFHKLSYIMHIFKYYFAEETNLLLVEVISRYPVDEKILTFYKQKIETINKKKVEFIYKSVPNMLGGFKLRWHEGEIDATLRRRVDKIKDMITKRKV
jgi:F0F1-type ATP synthase delta subunit